MHAAASMDEFDGNFGPVAMRNLGQQHQAVDARIFGDVQLGRIIGGSVPVDRRRSQRDERRARPGLLLDKVNVTLRRLAICGRVIRNHGRKDNAVLEHLPTYLERRKHVLVIVKRRHIHPFGCSPIKSLALIRGLSPCRRGSVPLLP